MKYLFGLVLALLTLSTFAQRSSDGKEIIPDPSKFVFISNYPRPVNMDSVRRLWNFPPIVREVGMEESPCFKILIDENGKYMKHLVIRGTHSLLLQTIEPTLQYLRFTPVVQSGKNIKFWISLPIKCIKFQ